jgi:probable HAF family extracellular repeat protein
MKRNLLWTAMAVVVLVLPYHSVTAAKPVGNVLDLGTLGGQYSDAFGINNDQVNVSVVGWSHVAPRSDFVHAFLWQSTTGMIDIGALPGGTFSQAYDVNNNGQAAGVSNDAPGGQQRAVLWTNLGGVSHIENLGALPGACCASAHGLNNGPPGDPAAVAIVGSSSVSLGISHAVEWTNTGSGWVAQDLGTLPGDTNSAAEDVNDLGEIVGGSSSASDVESAFLLIPGTGMLKLPGLGGNTSAMAINNSSDVAGSSTDQFGNAHAVVWRSATNWSVEDLGTLGGCCSGGLGINSVGDVVGFSNIASHRPTATQHSFLARAGSATMTDLGGRGGSAAWDLNDYGLAVGGNGGTLHAALWRLP